MADLQRLGAEVREARECRRLSLRALAATLRLSPGYVSDIENGRRAPSHETLDALALTLGCAAQRERWNALCGRLPDDIAEALFAHPERWDDVRKMLGREMHIVRPSGRVEVEP